MGLENSVLKKHNRTETVQKSIEEQDNEQDNTDMKTQEKTLQKLSSKSKWLPTDSSALQCLHT